MKFSLRDLLLVTVIVALAAGWAIHFWQLRAEREKNKYLVEAIRNSGFEPSGGHLGPHLWPVDGPNSPAPAP